LAPPDELILAGACLLVPDDCNTGVEHSIHPIGVKTVSREVVDVVIIPLELNNQHDAPVTLLISVLYAYDERITDRRLPKRHGHRVPHALRRRPSRAGRQALHPRRRLVADFPQRVSSGYPTP